MVRVDAMYFSGDAGVVDEFLTALRANGVDIHRSTGQPDQDCPLVVLITPGLLDPEMSALATSTAASYSEVLPISFLPGAAPLFAELSQSLITQLGPQECARRVATIARYGGRAIVDWRNLVDRAERWRAQGGQALMAEADITSALALMQSPPARESDRRGLVTEFLAASQAAVSRRRRIGTSVVAGTAVVLTLVLVFAVVQAVIARRAQVRAVHEGNLATSNRLARTAIDIIGGNPDLPALLTDHAMRSAPTPSAQEAEARVAASSWPHQSYDLGYIAVGVSAAANSPRLAVTDTDQEEIVVYAGPGGDELGRFNFGVRAGIEGGRGRLSPDGRMLLTKSEAANSFRLYDVDAGHQTPKLVSWQQPDDTLLQWIDDDHLLIGRANEVLAIDATSGETTVFASFPVGEVVGGGSMSRNRQHLVATTDRSLAVVNVQTRQTEHTMELDIRDAAVSDDGAQVVGINWPNAIVVDLASKKPSAETVPVGPNAILPMDSPYALVAGMSGELSIVAAGVETPIQTVRGHLSDRVRATSLNDGRVATVSSDGYLRVWSLPSVDVLGRPTSFGFVNKDSLMSSVTGVDVPPKESARSQLRLTTDGHVAVTLLPGSARVMSADKLETTDMSYFAGLDTDVFMSRDGSHLARVATNRINTYAYDPATTFWGDAGSLTMTGADLRMAVATGGQGVGVVSDDGGTVVLADPVTLLTYGSDGKAPREAHFVDQRTVVALRAGDGDGIALTADGYLRSSDGTEVHLALPATGDQSQPPVIAAGEFISADEAVYVTDLGDLYQLKSTTVHRIGGIGPGNDTFALRTSKDGNMIAVVGRSGVIVFEKSTAAAVYHEPAHGQSMVTDVDFDHDATTLFLVNAIGAVHRIDLGALPEQQSQPVPRDFTVSELTIFELNGN